MNHRSRLGVTLSAWALLPAAAWAGVCPFVFTHMVDGFSHTCAEVAPGVWDITLTITEDHAATVKVESLNLALGGLPKINELRLVMTDPDPATPAHIGLIVRGHNHNPANLAGIGRIVPDSPTGVELAILELLVNGDVGHITASRIYEARILGDLTEGITLPEARDQGPQEVSAVIHSLTIMGDLLGPIVFDQEDELQRIDTLVVGGDIGSAASPFELFVVSIGSVQCRNLNARLEALGLGRVSVLGQLNAPISAVQVAPGLIPVGGGDAGVFIGGNAKKGVSVSGAFDGDFSIGGFLGDGAAVRLAELPAGRRLSVGGDLQPAASVVVEGAAAGTVEIGGALDGLLIAQRGFDGAVVLGAGGLRGQIIVSSQGGVYGWNGLVAVGPDVLGPASARPFEAPYYEASAEAFGGGSVGLVPFRVHGADSFPADGAVLVGGGNIESVRIVHYGPVRIADPGPGGTACVRIERRPHLGASSEMGFADVTAAFGPAAMSVDPANRRELQIAGPFECGYEYRITPMGTELLCDLANGVAVAPYTYGFTLQHCAR